MSDGGLKRHSKEPFTIVRNAIFDDETLSWRAKGILAYLLGKPDSWIVRVKDVQRRGREGRDSIRAAFNELQDAGYAYFETAQGPDGKFLSTWHITDVPTWTEGKTPEPEKPAPVSPGPENPPPSKKDRRKTDQSVPDDAEQIYAAYPKKVAKPLSIKAIREALKQRTAQELLNAVEHLASLWAGADISFCQRASVWFKEERYNDDPATWGPREKAKPVATVTKAAGPAIQDF